MSRYDIVGGDELNAPLEEDNFDLRVMLSTLLRSWKAWNYQVTDYALWTWVWLHKTEGSVQVVTGDPEGTIVLLKTALINGEEISGRGRTPREFYHLLVEEVSRQALYELNHPEATDED